MRSECIGKSDFKKITDSIDKPLYDKMHEKMQTLYAKRMMKRRSSTVEPVLGTLLNFLNMKRVNTRGIQQANKHVLMAALTYNLKKYMKFIRRKANAGEMVCKIERGIAVFLKTVFGRFISQLLPDPDFRFSLTHF